MFLTRILSAAAARSVGFALIAMFFCCNASAQPQPATSPMPGSAQPATTISHATVYLMPYENGPTPDSSEARDIVHGMEISLPGGAMGRVREGRSVVNGDPVGYLSLITTVVVAGPPQADNDVAAAIQQKLRETLKPFASLSPAERAERLKKNQAESAAVARKIDAIDMLAHAQGDTVSILAEKVKQLKAQQQALRADRMAKEARVAALTEGLEQEKRRADQRGQNDRIAEELAKLVKMREEELAQTKQRAENGLISTAEVHQSDTALTDARIRLAEREAALAKSGKGELLDRLSDELAMVMIDMTDLKLREGMINDQLQKYDAATLDEKRLDELMKQDPDIGAAEASRRPPLLDELQNKRQQLMRERFGLTVRDVATAEKAM